MRMFRSSESGRVYQSFLSVSTLHLMTDKKEDYLLIQAIFVSILLAHLKSLYYPLVNKYLSAPVGLISTHSFFYSEFPDRCQEIN